jgi:hypothetical protein
MKGLSVAVKIRRCISQSLRPTPYRIGDGSLHTERISEGMRLGQTEKEMAQMAAISTEPSWSCSTLESRTRRRFDEFGISSNLGYTVRQPWVSRQLQLQ